MLPVVWVLLAAALFGTTGTAQALGPESTTPVGVGAARLVVGGSGLLLLLPILGHRVTAALRLWRTGAGLLAGGCTAAYQLCFFAAVAEAGVAVGTLVTIGSGPVFAGLLSWLVLRERPSASWIAATGLCAAGLALLSLDGLAGAGASAKGVLLALASGLGYAVYTVLSRSLIRGGAASEVVMAAAFGLGGLVLLPVLAFQPLAWLAEPGGWALAAYLGLGTTTLAYVLFGRGLAVLPAGPVTTLVLAEPLVATALGVTLLDERLPATGVAGAVLILVGLVLQGVVASRRPREPVPPLPG
ncbi:MAG: DMT family transporter [Nocardioides sp.]